MFQQNFRYFRCLRGKRLDLVSPRYKNVENIDDGWKQMRGQKNSQEWMEEISDGLEVLTIIITQVNTYMFETTWCKTVHQTPNTAHFQIHFNY